jgi:hypothetical protein
LIVSLLKQGQEIRRHILADDIVVHLAKTASQRVLATASDPRVNLFGAGIAGWVFGHGLHFCLLSLLRNYAQIPRFGAKNAADVGWFLKKWKKMEPGCPAGR